MKKLFRKLIFFLIFFFIFSLVINTLYLVLIASTDWDFRKRIETMRFSSPDFEILVLGSSIAQYGIDTEYLTSVGKKAYNMALVGSSVKTYYYQLNEYFEKYSNKPKHVILAVNSSLEEFDQEGIHPVVEFTTKHQKIDLKDIPVSKFRWQGTELFKKAFSEEYRRGFLSYGQLKREKVLPDNSLFSEKYINFGKFNSALWISKMAEICSENSVQLIIVEVPCVNETQNLSEIGPHNIVFENGFSANLYNLNNRDFCKFIDPLNDWVGMSHFNIVGARKFTEKLTGIIPL